MGFEIEDGTGQGFSAKVDNENRLATSAVTETIGRHINRIVNKNWSLPFDGLNPTAAGDYVLYIKNTGNSTLIINDVRIKTDTAASQIELHGVSGIAVGGTTLAAVNKTIGASEVPTATIETGVDITGLTSDGIIYYIHCDTAEAEQHLRTSSGIRIPKGKALAILVETATANLTGIISIVEEE